MIGLGRISTNRNGQRSSCLFWLLALASVVSAAPAQVSVKELAAKRGLTYADISRPSLRGCRVEGEGRTILFFEGLRNVLVDGVAVELSSPVQWDGASLLIPEDAAKLFHRTFGLRGAEAERDLGSEEKPPRSSSARPARRFAVVLDPGHGGNFPGAIGRGGLEEKTVNLDIALRVAEDLRGRGVRVTLTRTTDTHLSPNLNADLNQRVAIANRIAPDLFVSIHANAEVSRQQSGALSLYPEDLSLEHARENRLGVAALGPGGPVGRSVFIAAASATFETYRVRSIRAAQMIQRALAPVTGTVEKADGVIEDFRGLRLLRNITAPSVLVEVDFLSNPDSERRLRSAEYRGAIARAVAQGIWESLNDMTDREEGR